MFPGSSCDDVCVLKKEKRRERLMHHQQPENDSFKTQRELLSQQHEKDQNNEHLVYFQDFNERMEWDINEIIVNTRREIQLHTQYYVAGKKW